MRHKTTVVVLLILLLLPGLGAVHASPPSAQRSPLPMTIGFQSNTDWLLLVARDLHLFEQAGLRPSFVKFVAGPPMIAAARERSIDVASIGSVPFISGLTQGVDWVVVGINPENAYGEGLVARRGSGIETVADLAGKRIGFYRGSTAHFGLMMALRQLGIRRDQVELLDMSPAEQLSALAGNRIDAAMVWEPWMQRMVHETQGRLIVTEGAMGIYASVSVYAARSEWLSNNREAAVRFLRALLMASEVMQKAPEVGIRALAREMSIKEEWAEAIYENSPPPDLSLWVDPRYRYSLVKGAEFHRRLGYLVTFLLEEEVISEEVDVRNILDVSVIAEALKAPEAGR
ncbi:aliphatic sulfonate ABC transporter substrate-binding protein [Pseudomonas sp. MAP12]|uniref:Aliphatic sulfonate ABC transporter substrate-binding protein n=1 Tax=Geopseudomonas aromaticivorans TaxID=2849492 RepID=A0ABS6MT21_9GAMM|nr:aliphatic sulfonate ABC transporter substrate-binding protein [Pseudomonas aromaticivorans]MBV2131939.1 aliphatic sulfonate ABC transporter substrate-binding protein [Pseudomonas aromaticivorans]